MQSQLEDPQAEAVRTLTRNVYHTEVFGLRNVSHSELADLTVQQIKDKTRLETEKIHEQSEWGG